MTKGEQRLSRDVEIALFVQYKQGNQVAGEQLVTALRGWLVTIIKRHVPDWMWLRGTLTDDNEFVILAESVARERLQRFKPERGTRFSTYITKFVKGAVIRWRDMRIDLPKYLRDSWPGYHAALHQLRVAGIERPLIEQIFSKAQEATQEAHRIPLNKTRGIYLFLQRKEERADDESEVDEPKDDARKQGGGLSRDHPEPAGNRSPANQLLTIDSNRQLERWIDLAKDLLFVCDKEGARDILDSLREWLTDDAWERLSTQRGTPDKCYAARRVFVKYSGENTAAVEWNDTQFGPTVYDRRALWKRYWQF